MNAPNHSHAPPDRTGVAAQTTVQTVPPLALTILLVDDNALFLTAMRHMLARVPGLVLIGQAMDGLEGLVTFDQLQPDIVLTDLSMPVMSGLELARMLQLRPAPPCVILLSAHDAQPYLSSAKECGALAFINKANLVPELLPMLEALVAKRLTG